MTSALETFKQELQSLEIQGKAPNDISVLKQLITKYEQRVITPSLRACLKRVENISRGEFVFFTSEGRTLAGIVWEVNVPDNGDYNEAPIKIKLPAGEKIEVKAKDILLSESSY